MGKLKSKLKSILKEVIFFLVFLSFGKKVILKKLKLL